MTGSRKFRFSLACLLSLIIAFAFSAYGRMGADVLHAFVLGLVLLSASVGGANGIEHVAGAIRAGREKPGAPAPGGTP